MQVKFWIPLCWLVGGIYLGESRANRITLQNIQLPHMLPGNTLLFFNPLQPAHSNEVSSEQESDVTHHSPVFTYITFLWLGTIFTYEENNRRHIYKCTLMLFFPHTYTQTYRRVIWHRAPVGHAVKLLHTFQSSSQVMGYEDGFLFRPQTEYQRKHTVYPAKAVYLFLSHNIYFLLISDSQFLIFHRSPEISMRLGFSLFKHLTAEQPSPPARCSYALSVSKLVVLLILA